MIENQYITFGLYVEISPSNLVKVSAQLRMSFRVKNSRS